MIELTQQEQTTLEIFTADEGAFNLVYKLVKDKITQNKDVFVRNLSLKKELSNEDVGAKLRAFDEGTMLVDAVFRDLGAYKKKTAPIAVNPGR